MPTLFLKKVLIILRKGTKDANFWLGVQYPLKVEAFFADQKSSYLQTHPMMQCTVIVCHILIQVEVKASRICEWLAVTKTLGSAFHNTSVKSINEYFFF